MEHRRNKKSTVFTSQLPVENWHDFIDEPTLVYAILDQLLHSAHKLNLKGGVYVKTANNIDVS